MEERRLEMKAKKEAVVRRLIDEIAKLSPGVTPSWPGR
jgi:hypothetical protein